MNIRRLNTNGIKLFSDFIREAKQNSKTPVPTDYLTNDELSEPFLPQIDIRNRDVSTRLLAGHYLYELLGNVTESNVDTDEGLWAWLSLFFFDQVCPVVAAKRKISNIATLIPDPHNHQRYYRHLLAGPFFIYRLYHDNPGRAMSILCQPTETPGAVVEEIASRQELVRNCDFIQLVTRLYYDPKTKSLRRGSGGKSGGSARRLAKNIHEQLELTWDLKSVGADALIDLLPGEFDKFKKHVA